MCVCRFAVNSGRFDGLGLVLSVCISACFQWLLWVRLSVPLLLTV